MKPTINFKFNDLAEASALSEVVETKLETLGKFFPSGTAIICDVEFAKVAPQQHGAVHRVEVNCQIDGELFRAEATEDSFELAIDEVRDELDKEIRRHKEKHDDLIRKGGREIKEQLREG